VGNVWSLALIERELAIGGDASLADYLDTLPENLRGRLVSAERRLLLVTGHFPDLDAPEMRASIAAIEADLDPLRAANPDVSIELTGASVVSALHATSMINDLNRSLMTAIVVVIALIGISFRSLRIALLAVLPNMLPLFASGALLYVIGFGIDYAAMIALTVAFGIAVDDTIHFIARFQIETDEGRETLQAVQNAMRRVGPVMAITSVVLMCGVGVTMFGQMPQTRHFGAIVIVTLFSAIAADLLVTPAEILVLSKFRRDSRSNAIERRGT
jgi:predicted RND superfamily exporter protein